MSFLIPKNSIQPPASPIAERMIAREINVARRNAEFF
jgi:hypothetical protein